MLVVPALLPVTVPALFTVATVVLLLTHTPAAVALANAVVPPAHSVAVPVTAAGTGFTTNPMVRMQPVVDV